MQSLQEVLAYDYNLDLTGWRLYDARGISADGRTIMGYGGKVYEYPGVWIATLGSGPPCTTFVTPDLDHDCDVDVDDVNAFRACSSGAGVPARGGCEAADFDQDGDVDMSDFDVFQRDYTGPASAG